MAGISNAAAQTAVRLRRRSVRWWIGGVAGMLVVLLAVWFMVMLYRMSYVPPDLDLAQTQRSAQGLYQVSYASRRDPVPVNQIHAWVLHVETATGQPVTGAQIAVDGDMPQHGHGLPTSPAVTRELGNGDYLVEGVKFHMHGWWVMDFAITAAGRHDTVRFNLLLK